MTESCLLPLITGVKRGSLDDGPGIRSVVFFKGCPLHCAFCHNPEAQNPGSEVLFKPERCVGCGACVSACPREAIRLAGPHRVVRDLCDGCGRCADVCPGGALEQVGRYWPPEELLMLLLRDTPYYRAVGRGGDDVGRRVHALPGVPGLTAAAAQGI